MLWYLYAHRNATEEFWKQIELPNGADEIYVCIGVKASNYFMPAETLSDKGPGRLPGGEGWVSWTIYGTQTMLEWRFEGWKFGIYVILCLFTVVIGCTWYILIYPMSNPYIPLSTPVRASHPPFFPGGGGWIHFNKHLQVAWFLSKIQGDWENLSTGIMVSKGNHPLEYSFINDAYPLGTIPRGIMVTHWNIALCLVREVFFVICPDLWTTIN